MEEYQAANQDTGDQYQTNSSQEESMESRRASAEEGQETDQESNGTCSSNEENSDSYYIKECYLFYNFFIFIFYLMQTIVFEIQFVLTVNCFVYRSIIISKNVIYFLFLYFI